MMVVPAHHVIAGVIPVGRWRMMIGMVIMIVGRETAQRKMLMLDGGSGSMLDAIDRARQIRPGKDKRQQDGEHPAKVVFTKRVGRHAAIGTLRSNEAQPV